MNTFGTTFYDGSTDTFGDTFGSHGPAHPLAIADMVDITDRRVYDELLAGVVASDQDMTDYLELRTVNPEVSDYDWSGMSGGTEADSIGDPGDGPDDWTHSAPCTLISPRFGISAEHNVPPVGGKCWFLTPAGDAVIGTVAAHTTLTLSRARLVRFTSNPSALLERYPIITDGSLQRYVAAGGKFWTFYQTLAIKLREFDGFDVRSDAEPNLHIATHADSDWAEGALNQGSSRPGLVPLNDGRMVLVGTLQYVDGLCRVSLDLDEIQSTLAGYGESATTMDLPGYPGSDGRVNLTIRAGINRRVRVGIRE